MLEATIYIIDCIHDTLDGTIRVRCDNEEVLEEMVENYIDANSTDRLLLRYHIIEVEEYNNLVVEYDG